MASLQTPRRRGSGSSIMPSVEMHVPNIGDFKEVRNHRGTGKTWRFDCAEDPVATLESEKATLDVPATIAGRVLSLAVSAARG